MKTHRLFLIPLLFAFASLNIVTQFVAVAQTFKVTPKVMSATGKPNDFVDTYAEVENLASAKSDLRIQVVAQSMPEGWSASFCMVNCYAPDALDVTDTFDPQQKVSFHITWLTGAQAGQGSLTYKLTNVANPSESYTLTFDASTTVTDAGERAVVVKNVSLTQNYPNPFSLSHASDGITIGFSTVKSALVTLKVYDLIGHEVATIVNEVKPAGLHRVSWRGLDYQKNAVAPGIYIYKLNTGGTSLSRRLLITR
jgi:hypothetical protein